MEKLFGSKKFGFGCMRLPLLENGEVDTALFTKMVDRFMERGFTYFDTAHGYVSGKSEPALKVCLTSRYPRERYTVTDKLSTHHFNTQAEIRPLFESQLEAVGVTYFDLYLMHAQDRNIFEKFKRCRAYETALELKKEGKIRHFGISFHDRAEVLEQILTEYPQIEAVQIQFNYADYEDPSVESRKCYEVCVRHGKPVIVMEPVKGGSLARVPEAAEAIFEACAGGHSPASWAVRYAASLEGVMMVLSGMSSPEQLEENTGFMADFQPLSTAEQEAVRRVAEIMNNSIAIACTGCAYCVDGCPKHIPIPKDFALFNDQSRFRLMPSHTVYYNNLVAQGHGRAGDCIACGQCESHCPQHLPIIERLRDVSAVFDAKG